MKVLIVDDNQHHLAYLLALFQRRNIDTIGFDSAAAALEFLAKKDEEVDLLVTDVFMPGIDGIELLRRVRALRPELPVVSVGGQPSQTANSWSGCNAMRLLGADAAFPKPVDGERLIAEAKRIAATPREEC
jgi:CheY-like chemotaxis protein